MEARTGLSRECCRRSLEAFDIGRTNADAPDGSGGTGGGVRGDDDCVETRVTGGGLETGGHAIDETAERCLCLDADDRFMRTGHSDIGDVGSAPREDPLIGRLDMRVRAHHRRDLPIDVPAHGDLLGGGFGVEVHQDDSGLADRLYFASYDMKGIVQGVHEDSPHDVDHAHRDTSGGTGDVVAATWGVRIVRGAEQPRFELDVVECLLLVPDMIPGGHDIDARLTDRLGHGTRHAQATRRVLHVRDHEVNRMALDQPGQRPSEYFATRFADDVAHEENVHRIYDRTGHDGPFTFPDGEQRLDRGRSVVTPEEKLAHRVDVIESDHASGASALAAQAVDILCDAVSLGPLVLARIGRALCRAQPAMAPIWNAAALAFGSDGEESLRLLRARMTRAPESMSKVLSRLLLPEASAGNRPPLSLATVSQSGSVGACLTALADIAELRVICAEGRPVYEGRLMAASLARAGIAVTLCTDAAVGEVVRDAEPAVDAVVIGADAVTPDWFLNKCGTHLLATAAASAGIPVYVVASRATFLNPILAVAVRGRTGPEVEVWDAPPARVEVVNPYFERIPLDTVSMFVTDVGPIGIGSVLQMCESLVDSTAAKRVLATGLSEV